MSEEALGVIKVIRTGFTTTHETLYFTPDRTIVARLSGGKGGAVGVLLGGAIGGTIGGVMQEREAKKKEEQYSKVSLESILKADKNNYAVPNSEITAVELKKGWGGGINLNIETSKKYGGTKWIVEGAWKNVGEKYENILRSIFRDRLTVKK